MVGVSEKPLPADQQEEALNFNALFDFRVRILHSIGGFEHITFHIKNTNISGWKNTNIPLTTNMSGTIYILIYQST